jgi:hypothetical protein
MQKYTNNVQDVNGKAVAGAQITVNNLAGVAATIYSDDGVTLQANPINADQFGVFSFYAADGRYSLSVLANGSNYAVSDILLEDPLDGSDAVFETVTIEDLTINGGFNGIVVTNDNVAADAAIESSKLSFTQSGTGAVDRSVQSKLRDVVSVKDFGAVGDGVTDDSTAIQNALNAVSSDGTLEMEAGKTYLLETALSRATGIRINGNGSTIKPSVALMAAGGQAININTRTQNYTAFVPFVSVVDTDTFTIPVGVSFNVGDMLILRSTTSVFVDFGSLDYMNGMPAQVVSITGGVAKLDMTFYASFSIDVIEVYAGCKVCEVNDLSFDLSEQPNDTDPFVGLRMSANSIHINGGKFKGNQFAFDGMNIRGHNVIVENAVFEDWLNTQGTSTGGRNGSGIGVDANNTLVTHCKFYNCKHSAAAAGSRDYVVRGYTVENNLIVEDFSRAAGDYTGSIDCHSGHLGPFTCRNNYIYCRGVAFLVRNKSVVIAGNVVVQASTSTSVLINTSEQDLDNLVISGNTITLATAAGGAALIGCAATSSFLELKNVVIRDNNITNGRLLTASNAGAKLTNILIQGNTINTVESLMRWGSAAGVFKQITFVDNKVLSCLRVLDIFSSTDYTADKITIARNDILSCAMITSMTSASVNAFTGLSVLDNKVVGTGVATLLSLRGTSGATKDLTFNDLVIQGNILDNSAAAAGTAYVMDVDTVTVNRATVSGNIFRRGSGALRCGRFTACDLNTVVVQGNTMDNRFGFYGSDAQSATITDIVVNGNSFSHLEFVESAVSSPLALVNVVVSDNSMNYAGPGILFDAQAGSTGWASSTEVLVIGNRITSTSGSDGIRADADSTGNKIVLVGNVLNLRYNDASSTFYKVPKAHSLTTGTQPWKGGTTVNFDGELYAESAPVTGAWLQGDRVYDPTPAAAGFIGFVCTTAGTPGTWKTWGVVSA